MAWSIVQLHGLKTASATPKARGKVAADCTPPNVAPKNQQKGGGGQPVDRSSPVGGEVKQAPATEEARGGVGCSLRGRKKSRGCGKKKRYPRQEKGGNRVAGQADFVEGFLCNDRQLRKLRQGKCHRSEVFLLVGGK